MKAVLAIIVYFIMSFSPAHAGEPWSFDHWTTAQKVSYATSITAGIIDWGQTRTIAENHHLYKELNPILGKKPSVGRVNTHFALLTAVHVIAPHYSDFYRRYIMHIQAVGLTLNIARNHFEVGLRMSW